MSVTSTTTTELAAVASVAADGTSRESDGVEYPERRWIAQSVWHGDAVRQATVALLSHFREREDVLVGMELVVYYKRGDNTAWLQPDVQVVFDVDRGGTRSSFKVWEEGKAPDFVLEVASPSTAENDARHKATEYARIGVLEYWRLDPEGSLMGTPLEGYVASGGRYDPVEAVGCEGMGGYLRSQVLGLDLCGQRRGGATVVVFRDPQTGKEFDGGLEEADRRRRAAEERARQEAGLRRAAEERILALEERLQNVTARASRPGSES